MKTKILCGIIAILLVCALLQYTRKTIEAAGTEQMNTLEARQQIMNATLQINMEIPYMDNNVTNAMLRANGLGSLVYWRGETLLVTHNHWGSVLQEQAVVGLYDAEGRMVKTMSGSEFISLMVYLDAGTLIFRSPVELKGQPQLVLERDPIPLQAGDVVMVVQHEGPEQKGVTLVETEIEAVTTFRGLPVYQLRNLEGQPAQRGDSGGGLWHEGKLVGNLWYRMTAKPTLTTLFSSVWPDETKLEATIESYAAVIPAEQFISFQGLSADLGRRGALSDP